MPKFNFINKNEAFEFAKAALEERLLPYADYNGVVIIISFKNSKGKIEIPGDWCRCCVTKSDINEFIGEILNKWIKLAENDPSASVEHKVQMLPQTLTDLSNDDQSYDN
jgi:hypothetical protein